MIRSMGRRLAAHLSSVWDGDCRCTPHQCGMEAAGASLISMGWRLTVPLLTIIPFYGLEVWDGD